MNVRRILYGIIIAFSVVIVILFVFQLRSFVSNKPNQKEMFINHERPVIQFLSKEETSTFLQQDEDGYVNSLSRADLYARGVRSREEYLQKIVQSAAEFSDKDREVITRAIESVNDKLSSYKGTTLDAIKLRNIPWKIALTHNETYENGYPHTRQDVIFIGHNILDDPTLANTLLHEKVHIYQRLYEQEIDVWLEQKGYVKWKLQSSLPLARSNPDINQWVYLDPVSQKPMMAEYTSSTPSNISDVTLSNPAFEHPYEYMAYEIAKILPSNP